MASVALATDPPPPQNVVVILADDVDWADLPFFSEPVVWPNQDQPVTDPANPPRGDNDPGVGDIREAFYRRPDLNRTAARMMANPDGSLGRLRYAAPPDVPNEPLVAPVDLDRAPQNENTDETADGFRYKVNEPACRDTSVAPGSNPACPPSRDVVSGFGGLGRLAREGVAMPRFYANSAQCAPSRTAFITGRHQQRSGFNRNGDNLNPATSVTFAELLKSGCARGNPHACYRTGFFGKWNPSDDDNTPWQQGFDEFVGFQSAARPYFSRGRASCSPPLDLVSESAKPKPILVCQGLRRDYPCTTNADCPSGTAPNSCAPYEEECKPMVCDPDRRYCFNPNASHVCTQDSECAVAPNDCQYGACIGACRAAGRYIGTKNWTTCEPTIARGRLDCCAPVRGFSIANKAHQFAFQNKKIVVDPVVVPNVLRPVTFSTRGSSAGNICNDDGPLDPGALDLWPDYPPSYERCLYSDRLVRDFARNFLIRRLYEPDVPFLLVVTPKGAHLAVDAPPRTEAHYETMDKLNPNRPGDNSKEYWAVLEELDAVVGTILQQLDGMCGSRSAEFPNADESLVGKLCSANTDCGTGGHCVSHRDDTLVLFTNDNGSPGEGWGQPDLRGSKQSTLEGGTRVGLLARGPGLQIGHLTGQTTGGRANAVSNSVGGLIDIFSTVAEAAGYRGDDLDDAGRARVHTYHGTDVICSMAEECQGPEGNRHCSNSGATCVTNNDCTATCESYGIDGRSLISVLNGTGEAVTVGTEQDPHRRSFGYMNYPASGEPSNAVTARDRYFQPCDTNDDGEVSVSEATNCPSASHVCSYEGTFWRSGAVTQYTRVHHGSSCRACKPGGPEITDCTAERCEVVGKMCHSAMSADDDCRDLANTGGGVPLASACGLPDAQRCRGNADCPKNELCYGDVAVKCATCSAASWKARGNDDVANTTELFDLASNPEEDPKQYEGDPQAQDYYGTDGHLNCATHTLGEEWQQTRIQMTRSELGSRLAAWQGCVSDSSKLGQDCETPVPPQSE